MSENTSKMSMNESQLKVALEKVALYAAKLEKELEIKCQELEKRDQQMKKLKEIILKPKAKLDESNHLSADQVKDHEAVPHAKKPSEIACKFGPGCRFLKKNTCTFNHDTSQQPPAQTPSSNESVGDILKSLSLRLQVPEQLSHSIHTNPWSAS